MTCGLQQPSSEENIQSKKKKKATQVIDQTWLNKLVLFQSNDNFFLVMIANGSN